MGELTITEGLNGKINYQRGDFQLSLSRLITRYMDDG